MTCDSTLYSVPEPHIPTIFQVLPWVDCERVSQVGSGLVLGLARHIMPSIPYQLPDGVGQALVVIQSSLGRSIVGVYLFGSSVVGGLRPNSDLDIFVVEDQPLQEVARRELVAGLMDVSGSGAQGDPRRPVEVTVVNLSDIVSWRDPPKNEFVYGEWLRTEFAAGRVPLPALNPDLTIVLAKVRENSLTLFGPDAKDLLDPIPIEDVHRAIADSLPTLIDELKGDERNVLLTLARMWVTLATDEMAPKDTAAQWVMDRLPPEHRSILDLARRAYLGEHNDDWASRTEEVNSFILYAKDKIDLYI